MNPKVFISLVCGVMVTVTILYTARMLYISYVTEVMTTSLNRLQKDMTRRSEEASKRFQQQAQQQAQKQKQRAAEAEARRELELAQLEQEKRLISPECRFWWLQNEQTPSARAKTKKEYYCFSNN
ncbi:hypothetical protein ELR50_10985 [Pseudomonas citronellolis]|uniref:hypothetical protein n=1 Tax=Pseudomonas citronellolis TaxID=53408 RepID=UPI0022BA16E6|nr:hypothetical protein [Pseudomonas citronellolis]WBG63368.1 hypothetical protein ELR50_10985 [Pseudomonas citronellolis]